MNIDTLVAETRKIVKTHYEGMERLDMEDSDPAMLKTDLYEKLKAFLPNINEADIAPLYSELESKGYATLITNDSVTFSKDFIGA
jgi:hypothetical protein